MKLSEVLKEYLSTVDTWRETPFDDMIQTAELMKDMAIILSQLTVHKVKFKKQWNALVFSLRDETSIAAAEKQAHEKYPELDQIRQVIRAGNGILDTMRSQVSLLKSEK